MKHAFSIIAAICSIFLLSQIIGLAITDHYLPKPGKPEPKLPLNIERPKFKEKTSFIPIFLLILVATAIILLIIKLKLFKLWRIGFFVAIWLCLTISFSAFIKERYAVFIALILAGVKIFWKSVIPQNVIEIFIYGALPAIFVPVLNIYSASILLLLISFYDWISVRKTKHMVKMAKFQSKLRNFAGVFIPYKKGVAILGGGDIGFPLLFSGTAVKEFGLQIFSYKALIIPLFSTLALFLLFVLGKKKKFYPAMPYLSMGCFVGLLVLKLIS